MALMAVSAYECRCNLCGYRWLASIPPETCPSCASPAWNGNAALPTAPAGGSVEKKYPARTPVGGIITPQ